MRYAILLLLLVSSTCWAAPEITGVGSISNGSNVTITGTGFGSAPTVVFFTDFEQGSNNVDILTGSGSANVGEITAITAGISKYSSSAAMSGNLSFQTGMESSETGRGTVTINLPSPTDDIFMSWYLYIPLGDNYPGEGGLESINWKPVWILGADQTDDDLVVPVLLGDVDGTNLSWLITGNDQNPGYFKYLDVDFVKGRWARFAVWIKGSSNNTGQCHFWVTDAVNGTIQEANENNVTTLKSGGKRESVVINAYGRVAADSHPTFDDVYIATGLNARARIEIGDSSTYTECTKFSVCTPSSWSTTSIVATSWVAAFDEGVAYLYVTDADGAVNANGYQITLGSGTSHKSGTGSGTGNIR